MRHVDIFGRIQAVETQELNSGSDVEVGLSGLQPIADTDPIAIAHEFIRIAEQAVELRIGLGGILIIVGVIGGGAPGIGMVVVELEDGMLADRLGI